MGQMNRLFILLAVLMPIVGAIYYFLQSKRSSDRTATIRVGIIVGLLGPMNYLLWNVYNSITDKLGLDSVKNLVVNVVIFVLLGVVGGLIIGRLTNSSRVESTTKDIGADAVCDGPVSE